MEPEEKHEDVSNMSFDSPTFFKQDVDDDDADNMLDENSTSLQKSDEDFEKSDNNLAQILEQLVQIQKDDKADDRMGNKKFLLSLLPFMEKLPDDVNLEVRLQLMSILQTYSSGESLLKTD